MYTLSDILVARCRWSAVRLTILDTTRTPDFTDQPTTFYTYPFVRTQRGVSNSPLRNKVVQLRSLTSDITNSKVSRLKLENCKVSHLKLTYCEVSHLKVRELQSLTSESSATAKSHI